LTAQQLRNSGDRFMPSRSEGRSTDGDSKPKFEFLTPMLEADIHRASRPWKAYACAGEVRDSLCRDLLSAHAAGGAGHAEEYAYYPCAWKDPYCAGAQASKDLYGLLGIPKGDVQAMARQYVRNYEFFDAPVGLLSTLDRHLDGQAAWLDLGMYLHGVSHARPRPGELPQQAFARCHKIIRAHLDIPGDEIVVCGMSLGRPDPDEPVKRLMTAREPVSEFARFVGL